MDKKKPLLDRLNETLRSNPLLGAKKSSLDKKQDTLEKYAQHFGVVAEINQVLYLNDGASSTVKHTSESLQLIEQQVVLIIGGLNSFENYSTIAAQINDKIDSIVVFGVGCEQLLKKFEAHDVELFCADNLNEAVFFAYRAARENYVVLFSPASLPVEFNNLEERTSQFENAVKQLV
jgi:UDP-N-acetylmuramoylalanine-D-glutamate ligase